MTLDAKARGFARLHPMHDRGTWHLWCASLMYRMCAAYGSGPIPIPASAKIAGDWAGKLNLDRTKAPVGAFHYWRYGVDGHVGLDTKGGGKSVFMASAAIEEAIGNSIGFQSVVGYTRNGAYPYRGWSMLYGKNGKITQEVVVATPTVPPVVKPVAKPNVAMQWAIDNKIVDPGLDPNAPVTWNSLLWTLYRARGKS